jgi:hypothetical protein
MDSVELTTILGLDLEIIEDVVKKYRSGKKLKSTCNRLW